LNNLYSTNCVTRYITFGNLKRRLKNMDNKNYCIPNQLYGNLEIPSTNHASWPILYYGNLITGPYSNIGI